MLGFGFGVFGFRILDFGFWVLDFGFWVAEGLGVEFWPGGSRFRPLRAVDMKGEPHESK